MMAAMYFVRRILFAVPLLLVICVLAFVLVSGRTERT